MPWLIYPSDLAPDVAFTKAHYLEFATRDEAVSYRDQTGLATDHLVPYGCAHYPDGSQPTPELAAALFQSGSWYNLSDEEWTAIFGDDTKPHGRITCDECPTATGWTRDQCSVALYTTAGDRNAWRQREQGRIDDYTYQPVPWATVDRYPDHYVHLSTTKPGLVAYTEDDIKGIADRQTALKAGRYLERFYSDIDKDTRLDRWIAECASTVLRLNVTTDPDVIEQVFTTGPTTCDGKHRPTSCMSYPADHYRSDCHPVRVYGDSPDLAVAYVGTPGTEIKGRSIVWPAKKLHSKIYGSPVTNALLAQAGYTAGSLTGARIRAVEDDNTCSFIVPYIDGISHGKLVRPYIILGHGYDVSVQNTDGVSADEDEPEADPPCDVCGGDPDDCSCFTCEHCDERHSEDNYAGDGLCTDCASSCEECGAVHLCDNLTATETNRTLCTTCIDDLADRCLACGNSFLGELFLSRTAQRQAINNHLDHLCETCMDGHWYCPTCETAVKDNVACCGMMHVHIPCSWPMRYVLRPCGPKPRPRGITLRRHACIDPMLATSQEVSTDET